MENRNFDLEDVTKFYNNLPEWAKNGGLDGYWCDEVEWASTCHISDYEDEELD